MQKIISIKNGVINLYTKFNVSVKEHNIKIPKLVFKNIAEFCYSAKKEEVISKDYNLATSKYVEFVNRDENIDYKVKMTELQDNVQTLLKQEKAANENLLNVFKNLGYEIEL